MLRGPMRLLTIILILPFIFSFVDPKIGGTLYLSNNLKLSDKKFLNAEIVLHRNNVAIAKATVKNVIFPQAFVVTPKNALPEKHALMTGNFNVQIKIFDQNSNKTYIPSEKFENIPLGSKDLKVKIDQSLP